ncbi:hypothetical protein FO470_17295 [Starkeya sp. 3C]|uniref:Uncharacterized protein n=1 Tax=Ancylobacter moscoviensis TaxID=2597768 RepID=A0ABY3DMG3_9HYPH|nr:hypothetical protein [Ancylobacter moscoviensis]TSJ60506.1 hypothetical protein FO470_17295 [Ancylobacter moscoviensis]
MLNWLLGNGGDQDMLRLAQFQGYMPVQENMLQRAERLEATLRAIIERPDLTVEDMRRLATEALDGQ